MKNIIISLAVCFCLNLNSVFGLNIVDSTFNNGKHIIPVYKISWTDIKGKTRIALLTKEYATDNYPGICVWLQYFDGNTPVVITSQTPSDADIHNRGFGATVHHYENFDWHWKSQTNPTFTLRFKGTHHAIFDFAQTIHQAKETVSYTFMDGLDYFQWQETVQCTSKTDTTFDSRGPYCTMDWDGNGLFDVIDGQKYEAKGTFSQPAYNSNWTFSQSSTTGIPFVNQWKNNREVGFVQTQTYTQQQAGVPSSSSALPASGSTVPNNGSPTYLFDYQMNFYDQLQKLTWGMPYGYLEGQSGSGTKNGWGQYSLSIIFDAKTDAGVSRLVNENKAIHAGNIVLTGNKGKIITTGPVGTKNTSNQTLSPLGFDHNYRAWWLQTDVSQQLDFNIDITNTILANPTFRIVGLTKMPETVFLNGNKLVNNVDYYASFDANTNEAWLTLNKSLQGSNNLIVQQNSDITIASSSVSPSSVSNNTASLLTFSVSATATNTIGSVKIDLSSIGGNANTTLTSAGNGIYTVQYQLTSGFKNGNYTLPVTVTDLVNNTQTQSIKLEITSGTTINSASVNPTSIFNYAATSVLFSVNATDDGAVSSVNLDLTSVGGGASVLMNAASNNNFTLNYNIAAGLSLGNKTIAVKVTDNKGNITSSTISINVLASTTYLDIYTDASAMVCSTCIWVANGTIAEQSAAGAFEGAKDFVFNYNVASYYAGAGLNIANWSDAQAKDFSSYDSLQFSYNGPTQSGSSVLVTLVGAGKVLSSQQSFSGSSTYKTAKIALKDFGIFDLSKIVEIDFSIGGVASGAGTLRIDNVRLTKQAKTLTALSQNEVIENEIKLINIQNDNSYFITSTYNIEYINITNLLGQIIYQKTDINNNSFNFIKELTSGIYIINIISKNKNESFKILKN